MKQHDRLLFTGVATWGLLLGIWLSRGLLLCPAESMHGNHEGTSYAGRLLEFRDQLAAGYLWPEWCTHFRGGLGAPYFTYYQPGLFYAASLASWCLPATRALGVAVLGFALLGYAAMFALVRARFGTLSAWLAASGLLLSSYAGTEIYVRGDFSEFSAMMVLPVLFWALAGWFEDGRWWRLVFLTLAGWASILLHPAVALIGSLLLAGALAGHVCQARRLRPALAAAAALGLSVGLSAFYWLPIAGHWDLISAEKAFTDFYHYANHFVDPLALLGAYHRQATIPFSLGPVMVTMIVFNAVVAWRRRGEITIPQGRLLGFALLAIAASVLMMTQASEPLWRSIPLLQRLQFPWRILTAITVLGAAAVGSMLPWPSEKGRAIVVASLVAVMCALSWQYTRHELDPSARIPQDVEDLARDDFAPDLRNEWLPRGARPDIPAEARLRPTGGPGCRVDDFQRRQGWLSCRVSAGRESFVILPHYFFPVGWAATLDGQPIQLQPDPRGLMRVDLPANASGRLDVRFGGTPMRRLGLVIAAASLGLSIAFWTLAARSGRANDLFPLPAGKSGQMR